MTSIKNNLKLDTGCAVSQISSQDRLVSASLTRAECQAQKLSHPSHLLSTVDPSLYLFQSGSKPLSSAERNTNKERDV